MQKKNIEDIQELKSGMGRINSTLSELVEEKGWFPFQLQPNQKSQNTKGVNAITSRSENIVNRSSPSTNQTIRSDNKEVGKDEV